MPSKQPPEPYRIKSVEPIRLLDAKQREERLRRANYNIFKIDARDIYIDLLTDSGTSAMSNRQWAALMMGDESYAGAESFRHFEATVREITGKQYIVPTHQGRSAENMMFTTCVTRGQYVLNNTHFDTTRGNTLHKGGIPMDFPCKENASTEQHPFKGNMDIMRLEEFIHQQATDKIAMVIMTITNNSVGGQPVSMESIRQTSELCKRHNLPFYFDCARFAENAYFIKQREKGYQDASIPSIVNEMFSYVDGAMMSAKKDGLANMGGFIALDDAELYERLTELMILIEGFPTYGGLAGRDMEILAVGLKEVLGEDYLAFRIGQVAWFGQQLKAAGAPIVEPTGGHAVFVDAGRFLPHIPAEQLPGQSLTVELYRAGGVRGVEIGTTMFGDTDPDTGKSTTAPAELVRLAMPRRVYTNTHYDYIADIVADIAKRKDKLTGYKITRQPRFLRHFTCDLVPLAPSTVGTGS